MNRYEILIGKEPLPEECGVDTTDQLVFVNDIDRIQTYNYDQSGNLTMVSNLYEPL